MYEFTKPLIIFGNAAAQFRAVVDPDMVMAGGGFEIFFEKFPLGGGVANYNFLPHTLLKKLFFFEPE